MKRLAISGNTYKVKEKLKAAGFKWSPTYKNWSQVFENEKLAYDEAYNWGMAGFEVDILDVVNPNTPKYWVKESWRFNLESMNDKIWCLIYDVQDGKIELPFEVAGKTINSEADLYDLKEECSDLLGAANWGKVSGKVYGRIKEVVAWRVVARYNRCIASGMDEAQAGVCFEDM